MSLQSTQLKNNPLTNYFDDWTMFEKAWLIVFTTITIYLYFAWDDTIIGLVASLTGMLTVVLVAKGRISNYYFGIINVVLYGYIAYQSQFFGDVMLNWAFFLPAQFIGLYYWTKHSAGEDKVQVETFTNKQRLGLVVTAALAIGGYAIFLQWLNGNLPLFDATSTVLSVIAQLLMIRRVTEQWAAWITIDVVSIYMWGTIFLQTGESVTMIVMWTAYLVNACYGWWNWRQLEGEKV